MDKFSKEIAELEALEEMERQSRMTVIITGFKGNEIYSVFFKRLKGIMLDEVSDDAKLLGNFKAALKVSDFVTVRVILGETE